MTCSLKPGNKAADLSVRPDDVRYRGHSLPRGSPQNLEVPVPITAMSVIVTPGDDTADERADGP